ncbi:MarR family winged helix-turn-helix transcriptional regulator [Nitratireductor sp. GZWM139]|uniref:MarR family winged helix-turn-helix transcriptional regulator n=1 Tax=Nitratireductor sp. GZWM139 TaxID=2950541 RepID=UPI0024BE8133|nr:MarR family winged helix-turn-helix transcriptional regulator [Nitratireductor sp. GZWM139]MDJ1464181.1 MarR family winged helix-turn-helix transcriptional regulator [Nitratireductor sp. GZWM139]
MAKDEERIEIDRNAGFVGDYLLYLLAAASDAASTDFHAHVREQGLRVPEWRILACLSDEDGQMVTQLAQLALMEQSHLTKIIDHMASKGLVKRRSDERDRRRVRVFLTAAGRALGARLVDEAQAHEEEIIARLRPGEAALLKNALKHVHALYRAGSGITPAPVREPVKLETRPT